MRRNVDGRTRKQAAFANFDHVATPIAKPPIQIGRYAIHGVMSRRHGDGALRTADRTGGTLMARDGLPTYAIALVAVALATLVGLLIVFAASLLQM